MPFEITGIRYCLLSLFYVNYSAFLKHNYSVMLIHLYQRLLTCGQDPKSGHGEHSDGSRMLLKPVFFNLKGTLITF
jgi:hypothetical protein